MAYTKILVVHSRLDKSVSYALNDEKTSLETVIGYALNRGKTERTCFETAINCDRERVYADMMDTKRRWGKEGRIRKGYHIIQSFAPGEVTPEEAHAVGVEFAQRLLGDRYEAVVGTHLDKAHLHSHIVFNSVSFVDGTMYRDTFQDYYGNEGIRGVSDAVCRARGLSVIDPAEPLHGPVSRAEWEAARKGRPTMRSLVQQDIDAALAGAYTLRSLWQRLEQMGYTVKHGANVKHIAVKPPGSQRFIRLDSLGQGYAEEELKARLGAVRAGEQPPPAASPPSLSWLVPGRIYRPQGGLPRHPRKLKGFRALCFRYLCLLGAIRRPSRRAVPVSRAEIIRFDRYQEQFLYLMEHRIETAAQLAMQYDALQAEIDALTDRRRDLYNARRAGHGGEAVTGEITQITTRLRALRRGLKLCARIEGDIPKMQAAVQASKTQRSNDYEKADKGGPGRNPPPGGRVPAHRGR